MDPGLGTLVPMVSRLLFGTLVCALAAVAGCKEDDTFQCVSDAQCGGAGICESVNYCSFPDPDCETGRRYGDESATGIAGQCVPEEEGTSGAATEGSGVSGSSLATTGTSLTGGGPGPTDSGPTPPPFTSGPSPTGEPETDADSVDPSSMSGESTGDDSDSTTGGSTMGETTDGPTSTTTGVSTCDVDEEDCFDCFTCGGTDPNACADAFDACDAVDGCSEVRGCFSSCIGFGICYECCEDVPQSVIDLALTSAECQRDACPVLCAGQPDVICNG